MGQLNSFKNQMIGIVEKLNIGKYNKQSNTFKETLVFKQYSFKLQRLTSEIIPKELFNHLMDLYKKLDQKLKDMQEQRTKIQNKRKKPIYSDHLSSKSEEDRVKAHQIKNARHNDAKLKKNNKKRKQKKPSIAPKIPYGIASYFKKIESVEKENDIEIIDEEIEIIENEENKEIEENEDCSDFSH